MDEDREWILDQIRERLQYYASLTTVGLAVSEGEVDRASAAPDVLSGETLDAIRADLGDCTRCRLHEKRRTIVFGSGNPQADLMFIGEGPGYEEDVQGLPFVGPAGQLLTRIIQAIERKREDVYIANVVKCRPPGNRDPEPDEMATCRPFLDRQILAVRPRVICTLGRIATQVLLGTEKPMRTLRGQIFNYGDALVVPTYHPAYLLRNPAKKKETWQDVQLVQRLLDEQQR